MVQTKSVEPRRPSGTAVPTDHAHTLTQALGDYVRTVADAVGVPFDGVMWEVTDTVTAYLALTSRSARHPGRDVMLVWNEWQGWTISVETRPGERPIVLARSGGDMVPAPDAVARLVAETLAPDGTAPAQTPPPAHLGRGELAERMNHHTTTEGDR